MKSMPLWTPALFACITLIACGSGIDNTSTSSSSSSSPDTNTDYTPVTGLYDTSTDGGNEQYLYISAQGLITAYNYLGDSVDAGDNCYREAIEGEANFGVTGKTLSHSGNTYTVDVTGGETLTWNINGGSISSIFYNNIVAANGIYTSSADFSLRIPTQKYTGKSIEDISAALCQ
ncbi:MAG TPA: hypothetical protein VIC08_00590 [Cellvibrionaceae bacterium]